jgi:hypothetical protein
MTHSGTPAAAAVEGFDDGLVTGLARPEEVDLDLVQTSPLVEHAAVEFKTVVDPDAARLPPLSAKRIHLT